jgi:hypothetical protein
MITPEEMVVSNLVLPLIKDIILPKINMVFKSYNRPKVKPEYIYQKFSDYLTQRYEKYLLLDTLVFPNKQTLLKKLYEPLTLICRTSQDKSIEIKIDDYPRELLEEYYRIIIEDTAGMGKSTIIKKLFLSIIDDSAGIPILIELRKINNTNDIFFELHSQISPIGDKIDDDILLDLIRDGQFIFMFDGFDEIPLSNRDYVIKELHKFIEKANNNYFIITSRPEDSLASFGDFQKFNVKPLCEAAAFNLIKKYDFYSYKSIANELINILRDQQNSSIKEFMANPFLVSLLYKSFEYKKDIPIKKSQFYSQIYDALFETHDLSKEGYLKREKHSNLHIDDFERVLRYLGYFTAIENKVEYDKNYIISLIDKLKKHFSDLTFKASDYLKDLIETVPLFRKDGPYYKWSHKSLQDYFAAKFIWIDAKDNQIKILEKIYNDIDNERFYNLLDIYYELDIKSFNFTILNWLLTDFKKYADDNYREYISIPEELVKQRIEYTFNKTITIVISKEIDYKYFTSNGDQKEANEIGDYYDKKVFHKYHSIYYYYPDNQRYIIMVYFNTIKNRSTIIRLLETKKSEIIKDKQNKRNISELKILQEDNSYLIDFDPGNILNESEIYEYVNKLLISNAHVIDYEKGLNKFIQIEEDKQNNIENDLLNW